MEAIEKILQEIDICQKIIELLNKWKHILETTCGSVISTANQEMADYILGSYISDLDISALGIEWDSKMFLPD